MNHLRVLGLNHTTSPLGVRERLAFSLPQVRSLLSELRSADRSTELVVVSTCNRVEVYTAARPVERDELTQLMSRLFEIPATLFESHLFAHQDHNAARHLFKVASSMDSMIAGETQILGQVRSAFEQARRLDAVAGNLSPLFQKSLSVGKLVLSNDLISRGLAGVESGAESGVAGAAVAFVKQKVGDLSDKSILSLGAGSVGLLVLNGFVGLSQNPMAVISRDILRASGVAQKVRSTQQVLAYSMADLDSQLLRADVVVSSSASRVPLVSRGMLESVMTRREGRPLWVIDIAVPRDFEHAAGRIEGVRLFDMDDLQREVGQSLGNRVESLAWAGEIIDREVEAYVAWDQSRAAGPTIDAMFEQGYLIARQELARLFAEHPQLNDRVKDELQTAMKRVVNRLLHEPIAAMKHKPRQTEPAGPWTVKPQDYRNAVRTMFQTKWDAVRSSKPTGPS